jgi:hypothetical protein
MKSQQLVEMKHFCPPQYDAVMVTQTKFKWRFPLRVFHNSKTLVKI